METVILKPKDILSLLNENEERLWTQRDASISSVNTDLGSSILGESKYLRRIHDHFSSLDKRKCCLSLTVCKTTFSNFRVVRNDGRDSGIEEGAMMKTPNDKLPSVPELNEKEFRVFRYAYMCAAYPVLGAPDPPSPQSPPYTPTERRNSRFQFKDLKTQKSQSTDSNPEDETPIVPVETLFELLRRIFRLSLNSFHQYEVYIRNSYSKREAEPNRILAEELVGQLAALENNCNPYYKPKLFMTQFGYDRWQRKEFNHIAELMRKFWHVAHPPKRNNHIQFLESVHEDYVILMEKILRYESAFRTGDNTLNTMLSSASVRLLKEFGLRYGIRELYRRIVYLRYLVANFDHSVWFIQHCTTAVTSILDILPNKEDLVRKELEVLVESITKLQNILLSTLSKLKSLFPDNKPPDGIDALIILMDKALLAKIRLKMPRVESLDDVIVHCLKGIFPSSYNEMKIVAVTDLKLEGRESLTPSFLNMMIGKIRDEVKYFRTYYESTFSRFCSVTAIAAQSLYTLFMDDLNQFFKIHQSQPVTKIINKQLLGLGYRLHQLDEDWAIYISDYQSLKLSQLWRENLLNESLHWLNLLKKQVQGIVLKAVASDKFTNPVFDDIDSTYQLSVSSISSPRDRSFSMKSITPSINSAFSGLASSNSTPVYNNIWRSPNMNVPQTQPSSENKTNAVYHSRALDFVKHKQIQEHDTRSLDGFLENESKEFDGENEETLTFGSLRSCSSLPDKLSKSYDHYLNVSRKALSFSQQIAKRKYDGEKDAKPINTKKFSPIENDIKDNDHMENVDDLTKEEDSDCIFRDDDKILDDLSDEEVPSDIEDYHSESEHSEFCFPPVSEIEVVRPSPEVKKIQQLPERSKVIKPEPVRQLSERSKVIKPEPVRQLSERSKVIKPEPVRQLSESVKRKDVNTPTEDDQQSKVIPVIPQMNPAHWQSEPGPSLPIHRPMPRLTLQTQKAATPVSAISNPSPKRKAVLSVSSSALDVTIILQRLIEFSQTLCHTFIERNLDNLERNFVLSSNQGMKKKMYEALSEIMSSILYLYVNNMLCYDLCGTTRREAMKLAGPVLMEHLQRQRDQGLIWGCRHNMHGEKNCFRYLNNGAELLCDRYEQVTKDMCTRVNNVCMMLECIEHYYQRLGKIFKIPMEGRTNLSQSSDEPSPPTAGSGQGSVETAHMFSIVRVQCRIMAYRINLFVNDAVSVLLSLKQSSVSLHVCLLPLTQFLQSYITSLQEWLYRSSYKRVMECLWIFMVENFEKQVFEIIRGFHGSAEYSQLLIQAFTHLLRFMTEQKRAIRISLLLPQADDVMFKLQLCATPTKQIITLYRQLQDYFDKCDLSSMYNNDFTLQLILHKLREDLLKYRKCFSGSQLVAWIMKNPCLVKSLGVQIERDEITRDVAELVGKKLLDFELILDTESHEDHDTDMGHDLESSLERIQENYPQLSIIGSVPKGDNCSTSSDTTPTHVSHTATMSQTLESSMRSSDMISPVHLSRDKNLARQPVEIQLSRDTPMSFSTMFLDSDTSVFENCDTHYYMLASVRSLHDIDKEDASSELNILVDQCFQSRISTDFLLHIIYSRRKYDSYAKMFLQNLPLLVMKKLRSDLDNTTACEIS